MKVPITISIEPEQKEWLKKTFISPSKLLRSVIAERMKKDPGGFK